MTDVQDSTPATARSIRIEKEVDAAPEEAFRILTDPSEVGRWFPLEAEIDPRVGGRVWLSWGPGCEGEAPIHIHEPPARFGWTENYGTDEAGRPIEVAVDFHVESREGVTVVRLVQSGFSASEDWDAMYDALVDGWSYFMFNLQHYIAHHRGTPRTMVWRRAATELGREDVWSRLLESGLVSPHDRVAGEGEVAGGAAVQAGRDFVTDLGERQVGTVISTRPGHHFAGILPGLEQSLLFVELEGKHVGFWLSTYGLEADRVAGLQAALDACVERTVT
jgi:uncharacterized protein YndB with AHSA1/START domain